MWTVFWALFGMFLGNFSISYWNFCCLFSLNHNLQETCSWFICLSSFGLKEFEADSSLSLPQCSDKVPASLLLTAAWNQMGSTWFVLSERAKLACFTLWLPTVLISVVSNFWVTLGRGLSKDGHEGRSINGLS